MEEPAIIIMYASMAIVTLLLATSIKVAGEHERFVVTAAGRYAGLKGPGLLLKFPGAPSEWHRVALNDEGVCLGDGLVKVHDAVFPAEGADGCKSNAKARVVSFVGDFIRVSSE